MFYIYLCAHLFHHTRRKIVSVHFFRPYHRVQNSIFVMKIYRKYLFFFSPTFFSRFFFLKKIEICFIFTFLYLSSTIHEEKLFLSIFFDRTNGSKTAFFSWNFIGKKIFFFSPTFFPQIFFWKKIKYVLFLPLCTSHLPYTKKNCFCQFFSTVLKGPKQRFFREILSCINLYIVYLEWWLPPLSLFSSSLLPDGASNLFTTSLCTFGFFGFFLFEEGFEGGVLLSSFGSTD